MTRSIRILLAMVVATCLLPSTSPAAAFGVRPAVFDSQIQNSRVIPAGYAGPIVKYIGKKAWKKSKPLRTKVWRNSKRKAKKVWRSSKRKAKETLKKFPYRAKVTYDRKGHNFKSGPLRGHRSHLQLNVWNKNRKGSDRRYRIPLRKDKRHQANRR